MYHGTGIGDSTEDFDVYLNHHQYMLLVNIIGSGIGNGTNGLMLIPQYRPNICTFYWLI